MKTTNPILQILTGLLLCLNFYLLYEFPPEIHRWGRIACSGSLLLLFLSRFSTRNSLLIGAMVLFFMADIFALQYDFLFPKKAFFALQSLAYLLMLIQIRKNIQKPATTGYERWFFSGVFIINLSFVFIIGGILADEVNNPLLEVFFYLYGFSAVLLISAGVLFHDQLSNNKTTAYLLAGLALVFSNVTGFSAHFLEFTEFFYIDRLLYVLGVASLVYFGCAEQVRSTEEDFLRHSPATENKFYHHGDIDFLDE